MMRKCPLLLIIVIFGLMSYTGCGEDDGGGGMMNEPPPGGGVPPPRACSRCPCGFFAIPMTSACWKASEMPSELPSFNLSVRQGTDRVCTLTSASPDGAAIIATRMGGTMRCQTFGTEGNSCRINEQNIEITAEILDECFDCMHQYTLALDGVIGVQTTDPDQQGVFECRLK